MTGCCRRGLHRDCSGNELQFSRNGRVKRTPCDCTCHQGEKEFRRRPRKVADTRWGDAPNECVICGARTNLLTWKEGVLVCATNEKCRPHMRFGDDETESDEVESRPPVRARARVRREGKELRVAVDVDGEKVEVAVPVGRKLRRRKRPKQSRSHQHKWELVRREEDGKFVLRCYCKATREPTRLRRGRARKALTASKVRRAVPTGGLAEQRR